MITTTTVYHRTLMVVDHGCGLIVAAAVQLMHRIRCKGSVFLAIVEMILIVVARRWLLLLLKQHLLVLL